MTLQPLWCPASAGSSASAPTLNKVTASPTLIELRIQVLPAADAENDAVKVGAFPNGPE